MPGFKDGPVPSPNYEDNNNNQFSEVTEFTNDVYVYGKLYADIDILEQETISFNNVDSIRVCTSSAPSPPLPKSRFPTMASISSKNMIAGKACIAL